MNAIGQALKSANTDQMVVSGPEMLDQLLKLGRPRSGKEPGHGAGHWPDGPVTWTALCLGLLRELKGIVYLYPEIADSALQFGVPQEELDRTKVLGPVVDERCLGAAQGVTSIGASIQPNLRDPAMDDPAVLASRKVSRPPNTARKQIGISSSPGIGDPCCHRVPRLVCDLEVDWAASLALQNRRARRNGLTVTDIVYSEGH